MTVEAENGCRAICTRNLPYNMKAVSHLFANMHTVKEEFENMALEVMTGLVGVIWIVQRGGVSLLFLFGLMVRRTEVKLIGRSAVMKYQWGSLSNISNTTRPSLNGRVCRPTDLVAHNYMYDFGSEGTNTAGTSSP